MEEGDSIGVWRGEGKVGGRGNRSREKVGLCSGILIHVTGPPYVSVRVPCKELAFEIRLFKMESF